MIRCQQGVKVSNLTVALKNRLVLEDVDFEVKPGKLCVLLGPNGAGKTTLIRSMHGLVKPQKGSIFIENKDISKLTRKNLSQLVCHVPQSHQLVYDIAVLDFVLMGRTPYLSIFSTPKSEDRIIAEEALKILGIESLENRSYLSLSGGERQLVLMARGLTQQACIMLLDEPTSNLDYYNQHLLLKILRGLVKEQSLTALVSLHDPNLAVKYADCLIIIKDKKVFANLDSSEPDFARKLERTLQIVYGKEVAVIRHLEKIVVINS